MFYDLILRIFSVLTLIGLLIGLFFYYFIKNSVWSIIFGIFLIISLFYIWFGVDIPILFRLLWGCGLLYIFYTYIYNKKNNI